MGFAVILCVECLLYLKMASEQNELNFKVLFED
jgi:hypothetical protein